MELDINANERAAMVADGVLTTADAPVYISVEGNLLTLALRSLIAASQGHPNCHVTPDGKSLKFTDCAGTEMYLTDNRGNRMGEVLAAFQNPAFKQSLEALLAQ
jgi:hypothetical protein